MINAACLMAHMRDYEQLNISMVFLSRDILYHHLTANVKCAAKHFISNWSYFVKAFGVCALKKNMLHAVGWLSAIYNDFFFIYSFLYQAGKLEFEQLLFKLTHSMFIKLCCIVWLLLL